MTQQNFSEILAMGVPVVLDCYADWCEPCKQLTPLLEKMVTRLGGRVILAKLNVDKEPGVTEQLGVKSLPHVMGIANGKIVDQFVGKISNEKLATFMETLVTVGEQANQPPDALEETFAAATQALEAAKAGNAAAVPQAAQAFASILGSKEWAATHRARATAGLVQLALLEEGGLQTAKGLLKDLKTAAASDEKLLEQLNDADVTAVMTQVELADDITAASARSLAELQAAVEADPKDQQASYDLCLVLYGQGQAKDAITQACKGLRRDRDWGDGQTRKLLLRLFAALGPNHDLTKWGRRKLSNVLL